LVFGSPYQSERTCCALLRRLDHYAIFMENHPRYIEACGAGEARRAVPCLIG
jgi:hypothetical protein